MTTAKLNTAVKTPSPPVSGRFRLPDIPEREPDEVTQFDQLFRTGRSYAMALHLGNPETTLVEADRWIIAEPGTFRELARYPDLMVAFDVDPELYAANNGYIVSEQGKPPDFVLEVASPSTATTDTGPKLDDYAALGVLEYWLFDKTGEHHGTRLAGYRLGEDGRYHAIRMDVETAEVVQGYSAALNLLLRWERGEFALYDPATEEHIATFDSERDRADAAETQRRAEQVRAERERDRADAAETQRHAEQVRAERERAARISAEARADAAEAELRRLRGY